MYFVYGKTINYNTNELNKVAFIIKKDIENSAFSIYLNDYILKFNLTEEKLKQNIDNIKNVKSIQKNKYNSIVWNVIDEKKVAEEYINLYKNNLIYQPEELYKKLDNYEKFKNVNEFLEYAKIKRNKIESAVLENFAVELLEDEIKYKCVDSLGTYYVFKCKSVLDYTVSMDDTLQN